MNNKDENYITTIKKFYSYIKNLNISKTVNKKLDSEYNNDNTNTNTNTMKRSSTDLSSTDLNINNEINNDNNNTNTMKRCSTNLNINNEIKKLNNKFSKSDKNIIITNY